MASQAGWTDMTPEEHTASQHNVKATQRGRAGFSLGNWTLKKKMFAILALMWVGLLVLVTSMAWNARNMMFDERERGLEATVGIAETVFHRYQERASAGEFTQLEARSRALDALGGMRFGDDRQNYIFAFDDSARVLYHPRREKGEDMSGYTDPNGVAVYGELLKKALASGSGFVNYDSRAANGEELLPKLGYVERFAPWQINLAAGVYTDDIRSAFMVKLLQYIGLLAAVGAALTVAFLLVIRSIYRGLGGEPAYAIECVREISDGRLGTRLDLRSGDQNSLLYHIEHMRAELGDTIANIRQASESIDVGAREIAAGNNDLSARTEQQAASLEETAASMEELTATVRQNADNAAQATRLSQTACSEMDGGREVIKRVVSTMGEIRESSSKISEIITMIDSIAFQTNLLALNAAVEAARAGEQGRGFAVVAGEVRQLASRSATAASDIKALIERSVTQVASGTTLVDEADNTMATITQSSRRVNDLMAEIAAASKEQTSGIEQVNQAVSQMDQVTQQNAALVEEAAAAASSLEEQSGRLYQSVVRFRI
ncbi:methyl-accepting chemotaxis protein [Kushneria indalinina]|uniref:Methyl-accepting chemotaxis sensory transducer with Cache sensor n=1 Tax=Kushneria indalinina DSM 14324 TaxID=1122140 RepID=A0A3D9DYT1_9GAMM|nr:methyl-accepting chemotaxis protein [Kushneria indalinina]REC95414.1 methyl-accepting chemotaxis sensory transducer with Cache sensor [Kushneria indalinina DSM 14324]